MEYERANGKARFIAISIEGHRHEVDQEFDPQQIKGKSGDFGVHFQLNTNKAAEPYSVWVHNLQLTYW
jgi:hypothetical protein